MNRNFEMFFRAWLIVSAFASCVISCSGKNVEFLRELNNTYQQLYTAHFALEYPPSSNSLKICQERQLADCLLPYKIVQNGKQTLQAMIAKDAKAVFAHTLTTIEQACTKMDPKVLEPMTYHCYGAVTALYYFTEPNYDKRLRDFLSQASVPVVRAMLEYRYEWFYNRPDVADWVTVINALPADVYSEAAKPFIVRCFKESQQPFEKFGLML